MEYHPGKGNEDIWRFIDGEGVYEIPLRTLRSSDTSNLFAAGKLADGKRLAGGSLRVMGTAFATGQACGAASARYAHTGDVDAAEIRNTLGGQGALIDAGDLPDRVTTLVYLTDFLLPKGMPQMVMARADTESVVTQNLVVREGEGIATIREDALREAFYGDCSEEDFTRAKSLLVAQPLAPLATPVETTDVRFGRVPKVYIECLRDQAITPTTQEKIYTELPCQKVIFMNASHSPFLSAPETLTGHLIRTSRLSCVSERAARPTEQIMI